MSTTVTPETGYRADKMEISDHFEDRLTILRETDGSLSFRTDGGEYVCVLPGEVPALVAFLQNGAARPDKCGDTRCGEPAGYSPVTVGDVLGHDDEDPSVTTWRTFGSRHIDNQPETVTAEAERIVYGGRGNDYGHPREDFTRTAVIWTGLLQHKLTDGEFITPEDVARLQIGLKLSRDIHQPKRDNRTDIAGYALCLDRLETGK